MTAIVKGFERDRLAGRGPIIRWWFVLHVDGDDGRPQAPRLGVEDQGFVFARGGRATSEGEAEAAITAAAAEARAELEFWRGQPSHGLGRRGELVALGAREIDP